MTMPEPEMPGKEQPWGGPLWAAADLITPMAVRVAATLRLADAIVAGQKDGQGAGKNTGLALAARLQVEADPLVRVLDHLVTAGFLRREGETPAPDAARADPGADPVYTLTDVGQWLRSDHPEGIRAWVDLDGALGHADLSMVELLHTVRTGEPAFDRHYGTGYWQDLADHPVRAASFNALMGSQLTTQAPAVAAAYPWARLGDVVDVGGGNGALLIALLREHPTLSGTVLDLAPAADEASRALAAADLVGRGRAVAGSFFDPLPAGAGGYILSRVLCDWDDDHALAILRNCATAAGPAGVVIVAEDAENVDSGSTEMDLRMLTYVGGRERGLDAITALAREAGMARGAVTRGGIRTIIEFTPAP